MKSNTTIGVTRAMAPRFVRLPLAAALLALGPVAAAQQLEEVIVTAQKRSESMQDVPISIQAIGEQRIRELNIKDFDDFAKLMPSVSYQSFGPGFSLVYMRGVASGGDGNHSGSAPSVGTYLDEQPITTIQGALDIHTYDIARIEALAGPQGTLYGASSQAGTIRIITNKPELGETSGGFGIEGNVIDGGDEGYVLEGHINLPVTEQAAIRLVGWAKRDGGYIDNVGGRRSYRAIGATSDNAEFAENDYNDVDTIGARAALRIELNENWTITPTLMAQRQEANGSFAYDDSLGDLKVKHFAPEGSDDQWYQAALTVEGRVGNFDVVYAGAFMKRDVEVDSDYSDYAFWYNEYFVDSPYYANDYSCYLLFDTANSGFCGNPDQYINGQDRYEKQSQELRISSPAEHRLRFVGGLFWQTQFHDIEQRYKVNGIPPSREITGWPDTVWLTKQERDDEDKAIFGELSYDITSQLTITGGMRYFQADSSLKGFFGYGLEFPYSGGGGERNCIDPAAFNGAPCTIFDKETDEDDNISKINLSYKITDDHMIYATWSEGYRPGGINRRGTLPPYQSDYLTNYELGWKTTWFDNSLSFNGAVFQQEWEDFQFSILGPNGLTEIRNAAQAKINGMEIELNWAASDSLTISGGAAFYDAFLSENYCGFTRPDGSPVTNCSVAEAPEYQRLPTTAEFKGNITARYRFNVAGYDAYAQGSMVYEGDRESDLRTVERNILGDMGAYTLVDLSTGVEWGDAYGLELYLKNAGDERAEIYKYAQCGESICGAQTYVNTVQPRTFGIRFSQQF